MFLSQIRLFPWHDIGSFCFENFIYPLQKIWVNLPGWGSSSGKSSATHSYQCVHLGIFVFWIMVWLPVLGILNMDADVMHVISRGDCKNTEREPALKMVSVMYWAFWSDAVPTELQLALWLWSNDFTKVSVSVADTAFGLKPFLLATEVKYKPHMGPQDLASAYTWFVRHSTVLYGLGLWFSSCERHFVKGREPLRLWEGERHWDCERETLRLWGGER